MWYIFRLEASSLDDTLPESTIQTEAHEEYVQFLLFYSNIETLYQSTCIKAVCYRDILHSFFKIENV